MMLISRWSRTLGVLLYLQSYWPTRSTHSCLCFDFERLVDQSPNLSLLYAAEFMSTLSSALHWGHLPAKIPKSAAIFGLFLGVLVALFGLGYSVVGLFHGQRGQPVRRRLLRAHWRDDLIGKTSTKPKRHLNVFLGLDLPPVGEGNFKYKLRSKSNPSSTNGVGRTDRLILYEGQVLTGDETLGHAHRFVTDPTSRRGSGRTSQVPPKAKTSSFSLQESTDRTMQKSASNERLPALREKISQDSQIPFNGLTNARNRGEKRSRFECCR